jgi:hypothetical protein
VPEISITKSCPDTAFELTDVDVLPVTVNPASSSWLFKLLYCELVVLEL